MQSVADSQPDTDDLDDGDSQWLGDFKWFTHTDPERDGKSQFIAFAVDVS